MPSTSGKLYLKPGRERALMRHHPWIFSGGVERVEGKVENGDLVELVDHRGQYWGQGFFNPAASIRARVITWGRETISEQFFAEKLRQAWDLREAVLNTAETEIRETTYTSTNAWRWVNGDGDGLPGLVVDRYGDYVVMQCHTFGMYKRRDMIVGAMRKLWSPIGILSRISDVREEGLKAQTEIVHGMIPPEPVLILENGLRFWADLNSGQKTGFFLDQRDNRVWLQSLCRGRRVLNCFGYTGGFSVYALRGGATRTVTVDLSAPALDLAKRNIKDNGYGVHDKDVIAADVFAFLRQSHEEYDVIILDPPALAHRQKDIDRAARAYKDVNLQAMRRLAPGGLLLTCSCSQPIDMDLFQKILFAAALDAQRQVRILGCRGHALDHPISLYVPESRYLQSWLLAVS